jgi:hypothetical protein
VDLCREEQIGLARRYRCHGIVAFAALAVAFRRRGRSPRDRVCALSLLCLIEECALLGTIARNSQDLVQTGLVDWGMLGDPPSDARFVVVDHVDSDMGVLESDHCRGRTACEYEQSERSSSYCGDRMDCRLQHGLIWRSQSATKIRKGEGKARTDVSSAYAADVADDGHRAARQGGMHILHVRPEYWTEGQTSLRCCGSRRGVERQQASLFWVNS